MKSSYKQAGVELGLTQAETVSLELGLIRAELELFWQKYFLASFFLVKIFVLVK